MEGRWDFFQLESGIIDVFSPKDNPSTIEYHPGKSGGVFRWWVGAGDKVR